MLPIRRRSLPLVAWIAIALGAGCLLGLIAMLVAGKVAGKGEPGFTVATGGSYTRWVLISNRDRGDLIINKILVNGEAQALPAKYAGDDIVTWQEREPMPVSIGIGESRYFIYHFAMWRKDAADPFGSKGPQPRADGQLNYPREAVFVEIQTNRGTYRYQDGVLK